MDCYKVGKFIASLRKEREMTQQDLAFLLGVDKTTVSKWENGRGFPDVSQFPRLAHEFGVSVDELMNGERSAFEPKKPKLSLSYLGEENNYGLTDEQFNTISKEAIRKRRELVLQTTAIIVAAVLLLTLLTIGVFSMLADVPRYNLDSWINKKREDYAEKLRFNQTAHKDVNFLVDGYDLPAYTIEGYELYKVTAEDFFVSAKYRNGEGKEYAFSVGYYMSMPVHSAAMDGKYASETLESGKYVYYGNGSYTNASLYRDGINYMLDGIGTFIPEEECRKIFESISFTDYGDEWIILTRR